jgi:hypothetical protein
MVGRLEIHEKIFVVLHTTRFWTFTRDYPRSLASNQSFEKQVFLSAAVGDESIILRERRNLERCAILISQTLSLRSKN